MNLTEEAPTVATRRLLHGLSEAADPRLAVHHELWGVLRPDKADLVAQVDASGLTGRGGAAFPVGAKWRTVAGASRRRPVVIANGAEGEPASRKDAFLLARAPHLVIDGLVAAACALRAERAIAYVSRASVSCLGDALAERQAIGLDPIEVEIFEAAPSFIAGQETAVVEALGPRRTAAPTFAGLSSIRERGLNGRPTLVQNIETLAHVALVARFGAAWFRQLGTDTEPGTMLLTLCTDEGPMIAEGVFGSSLARTLGLGRRELGASGGVLLGGYGGGWIPTDVFLGLPVSEKAARRAGGTLGPGIVAVIPENVCPLAEIADVARYMETQGAGQCGPCVYGLADLADGLERLAYGGPGGPSPDRLLEVCDLVDGRGACRHPDGVAKFVRSGLAVFAGEVNAHRRHGACTATRQGGALPGTTRATRRKLVSRA